MKVLITGFQDGKKIQAIKAIRASTALGLKEAKYVADDVEAGQRVEITVQSPRHVQELDEGGVRYLIPSVDLSVADLADVLSHYPQEMTVGQVVAVLAATARALTKPEREAA